MPALEFAEMPALMARLDAIPDSMPAITLLFAAHTAVRSWDIRKARRDHIDRAAALWTIPEYSTTRRGQQAGREHRVPLTASALELIDRAIRLADSTGAGAGGLLFPNPATGTELADNVASKALGKLGLRGQATMHGFRAAFRSWAEAKAGADHAVSEMCLGHAIPVAVERAYQRSDLLERRTVLMAKWSAFLTGATGEVIPFPASASGG
jgi:integrase